MNPPTPLQQEAYEWTHKVGLSNDEAAEKLGISRKTLKERLKSFFKKKPQLRPNKGDAELIRSAGRFHNIEDCDINHRF